MVTVPTYKLIHIFYLDLANGSGLLVGIKEMELAFLYESRIPFTIILGALMIRILGLLVLFSD